MKPLGPIPSGYDTVGGVLAVAGVPVTELVEKAGGTPLFVYSSGLIRARVAALRAAMPERIAIHYAVKANPYKPILQMFSRLVDGFDIASGGELAMLRQAADAGLVHTVNNVQNGITYICNCCTCSCGILRGIADLGKANVVARSAFVNTVDEDRCLGCEDCVSYCQFGALAMSGDTMQVDSARCVGCGVCVIHCTGDAMTLVRRPEDEIKPVPADEHDWRAERAAARGINLDEVL